MKNVIKITYFDLLDHRFYPYTHLVYNLFRIIDGFVRFDFKLGLTLLFLILIVCSFSYINEVLFVDFICIWYFIYLFFKMHHIAYLFFLIFDFIILINFFFFLLLDCCTLGRFFIIYDCSFMNCLFWLTYIWDLAIVNINKI